MINIIQNRLFFVFIAILLLGFILRIAYAAHLPLSNDEGSYLYDGLLLSQGKWPFNYSFSRSPVLMFLVAPTIAIFGRSYIAGRMISIFAGLASSAVLYLLGKRLFNKRVGFAAFVMFALLAPAVVHTSYLLTQPLEILLVLLGVYFTWLGIEGKYYKTRWWFAVPGLFFGLAVLTRETAAFYPVAMVLAILLFSIFRLTDNESQVAALIKGIFRSFVMGISSLTVWAGVWGLIVTQVGFDRIKAVFLAITSMHDTGEYWSFGFKLKKKWEIFYGARWENFILYALTAVFAVVLVLKIVEIFTTESYPKRTRNKQFSFTLFPKLQDIFDREGGWIFFLIYAAVPVLFYGIYYRRMQPEYLAEFMPLFVMMAAVAVDFLTLRASNLFHFQFFSFRDVFFGASSEQSHPELGYPEPCHSNENQKPDSGSTSRGFRFEPGMTLKKSCGACLALFTLSLLFINYRYMWKNQHGGTFAPEALAEAETFVRENVAEGEEIFTAAVIIPFLADRPLTFKMSRPVIFGYPHLDPNIRYTLFPNDEEILTYLEEKPVNWAIFDRTTWETFSRGHPELEQYLKDKYSIMHTIPNKRTGTVLEIGSRYSE